MRRTNRTSLSRSEYEKVSLVIGILGVFSFSFFLVFLSL